MPKRYLTGGGKDLKNQTKSSNYLYKALNYIKSCIQKFRRKLKNLNKKLTFAVYDKIGGIGSRTASSNVIGNVIPSIRKLRLRSANCGAILIEFAICMPVLIILLFYINDLVRIKRYYSQTEFVAQQMANILQNISQKRAQSATTDEERASLLKITKPDIRYAASLSHLSLYPGKTMYADKKRGSFSHELSHMPFFFIYCVQGLSGGKASVMWSYSAFCYNATDPTGWHVDNNVSDFGVVKRKTGVVPADIYPTLKITEGEVKIIIECPLFCRAESMSLNAYAASDDQDTRAKKAFGCRLVTPKASYKVPNYGFYFPSVVIFKPKDGLFDPKRSPA